MQSNFLVKSKDFKYKIKGPLGKGSYGRVFTITDNENKQYALKLPSLCKENTNEMDEKSKIYLNNEISILRFISHRNIVRLVDYKIDEYMVLDLYRTNWNLTKKDRKGVVEGRGVVGRVSR